MTAVADQTERASSWWWLLWGTLLAVLILGVAVLGLRNYRQRSAISVVEDLGAFVDVIHKAPGWAKDPGVDYAMRGADTVYRVYLAKRKLSPADRKRFFDTLPAFRELRTLRMPVSYVADEDLACLDRLPQLSALDLTQTAVTDEGMTRVAQVPRLEWLLLEHTKITDRGMETLRTATGLKVLSLEGTPITDAALEPLADLPHLERLYLTGTAVTDDGVAEFSKRRPKVRITR